MKLKNYTPHAITIFDKDNDPLATYQSVGLARAEQVEQILGEIEVEPESVPLKKMVFGGVVGLPEVANPDEYYIVSSLAAQAARSVNHNLADRLLVPSDPVRNEFGQIIGCKSFSVI